jgi:hypothetical protein
MTKARLDFQIARQQAREAAEAIKLKLARKDALKAAAEAKAALQAKQAAKPAPASPKPASKATTPKPAVAARKPVAPKTIKRVIPTPPPKPKVRDLSAVLGEIKTCRCPKARYRLAAEARKLRAK